MIFLSHRGNINGKDEKTENNPFQIEFAISQGYYVEVDVWFTYNEYFLGHDRGLYKINIDFLRNEKLLCHAKNKDSFENMLKYNDIHCFWHENDKYTLTSKNIPIIYPGEEPLNNSIVMVKNKSTYNKNQLQKCYGICSDEIEYFRNII